MKMSEKTGKVLKVSQSTKNLVKYEEVAAQELLRLDINLNCANSTAAGNLGMLVK